MKTKILIASGLFIIVVLTQFIPYEWYYKLIISAWLLSVCYLLLKQDRRKKPSKRSLRPTWCNYHESAYIGCYELQNDRLFVAQMCKQCKDGNFQES